MVSSETLRLGGLAVDCSNGSAVDIGDPGSAAPSDAAMTTYPNAPAPRSALFDDAPATQPVVVPAHLTPATRIAQVRGGRWIAVDVLMQYGSPIPLDLALQRVAIGRTVYVRREDAAAVMGAANGVDG